ncbi:NAD(P)-dependent oxidoreductase [uncultured Tessaracoccus sp.]|uniref:NAD-dependent epimerase/dehydratase family protein n=1 Tax=uncultured Tessaracoccus sp. TaxID=905023 RepID=UPI0025FF8B71|nr:NAD(P)-dependent oxidoreductase [uncultured Tessaracoccus sp.]
MKVAVTGASGFVGAEVVRAMRGAGHEVVSVGRTPVAACEHRQWDAATGTPDLTGCDAVVHAAAHVGERGPRSVFERVNVGGARRLLDAADGRTVVWVSSGSVYDPRPSRRLVGEDHPTESGHLSHYGWTKARGERLALEAGAVVLRPTAVYGLADRHLVPRLRRLVRGRRLLLPGPDVALSLTDVEAFGRACVDALDWPPGPVNIADPEPYSRDEVLARVLEGVVGRQLVATRVPPAVVRALAPVLPGVNAYTIDLLTRDHVLDVRRALALGWEPPRRRVWDLDWASVLP